MKTILVISQKGGSGKTTFACNFAVMLAKSNAVALLDTDPQGSTLDWGEARKNAKEDENLFINYLDVDNIKQYLNNLNENGADFTIIDTPPVLSSLQEELIKHADYVVIPLMATKSNFTTIDPLLEIVVKYNVPYGFVISNANQSTVMYRLVKDLLCEQGQILGTLNSTVKMQEAELNGLALSEMINKHSNIDNLNKIKNKILKNLSLRGNKENGK